MIVKKGDKFRCIKTLSYSNFKPWYVRGRIYTSESEGYITDEEGDENFVVGSFVEYFIPYISNKRKGYGYKKRK